VGNVKEIGFWVNESEFKVVRKLDDNKKKLYGFVKKCFLKGLGEQN
jgi:SPX domain protein involved in polyphosphate accumulation